MRPRMGLALTFRPPRTACMGTGPKSASGKVGHPHPKYVPTSSLVPAPGSICLPSWGPLMEGRSHTPESALWGLFWLGTNGRGPYPTSICPGAGRRGPQTEAPPPSVKPHPPSQSLLVGPEDPSPPGGLSPASTL